MVAQAAIPGQPIDSTHSWDLVHVGPGLLESFSTIASLISSGGVAAICVKVVCSTKIWSRAS